MSDPSPPVHARPTAGGDGPLTAAVLADFRAWLDAGGEADAEPLDLLALVREFTALRHDVQLQTKATRAAVERLGTPADPREMQRPLVIGLIDVSEALRIGLRQSEEAVLVMSHFPPQQDRPEPPAPVLDHPWYWRWMFRRFETEMHQQRVAAWEAERYRRDFHHVQVAPRLAAVADGYALSLRRADKALADAGVESFAAVGDRFDPETMEAIALDAGRGKPAGEVTVVNRRGYRWHGEVLLFAQVTVSG